MLRLLWARRSLAPGWQPTTRGLGRTSSSLIRPQSDTIYALSSGPGRAAIAVIRLTGPACLHVYRSLCPNKAPPRPRQATIRTLYDGGSNILDRQALILYFPGPQSATGEDVLELHVHGGPATVRAVLSTLPKQGNGVRYAEAGEFTRRAFLNNRLDLAQVEALSDGLAAETEQQRRVAVGGGSGVLGRTYEDWRRRLLFARAELEALIDFAEDQHFDESPVELLTGVVSRSPGRVVAAWHSFGREASIVSGEAGTTRDVVEAKLDLGGYLCTFADTAGLRVGNEAGAVEAEGIRRARRQAQEADVIVVVASIENGADGPTIVYDAETLELASTASARLIFINKVDTVSPSEASLLTQSFTQSLPASLASSPPLLISCTSSNHSQSIIQALTTTFSRMTHVDDADLLGVTERQRQLLAACDGHLDDFQAEARRGDGTDVVLCAEFLRLAADCLARITGRGGAGDVEELLGLVFERFCVGK
ncbi:hypothetical protein XA68_13305 [Ophiocordyceps unilateralis]|uniref:TrmE-type G domain-containing protein n=1 Tax=Ophiocordyceps unilateralis TaxID=268505 RepID=A0A2A9PCV5_OPHUN|nr:hypothetical protein XA68_13305 [Ophiocordyceps unilateralis]